MAPVPSRVDTPGEFHTRATLLSLPTELLEMVFEKLNSRDLLQVMQACHLLHDLVAIQMYREVVYTLYPSSGPHDIRSLERFASLVASLSRKSNNYSSNVREICVHGDSVPQPQRVPSAISFGDYECIRGCARYLNELMCQLLPEVARVVAFRWDIHVPLDPLVFIELGRLKHLQSLHIRLPAANSMDVIPPYEVEEQWKRYGQHPLPFTLLGPYPRADLLRTCDNFALVSGLQNLAVLDISSLDFISQIGTCVQSSQRTLRSLKLSFDDVLGASSRDYTDAKVVTLDYHDMLSEPNDSDLFVFSNIVKMKPGEPATSLSAGRPKAIGATLLAHIFQVKLPNQDDKGGAVSKNPSDGEALKLFLKTPHIGLALDSLSICRISVLHHVLIRGVDVTRLKHLSLLTVGPQGYIWAALNKIHGYKPLRLTSIHTDSVSRSLLRLIANLDTITELYMFRRRSLHPVQQREDSLGFLELREAIFPKHIQHLQRLVLRNDCDISWALDSETINILAAGVNLIELGIGVREASCPSLVRQIHAMTSLEALQIFWHSGPDDFDAMIRSHTSLADYVMSLPNPSLKHIGMFCVIPYGEMMNRVIDMRLRLHWFRRSDWLIRNKGIGIDNRTKLYLPTVLDIQEAITEVVKMHIDIREVKMWKPNIWEFKL
ncbi:hypothetical protein FE257_010568 [Aspergillus nanangensis]|uniref:F-box domain-containing protein n=1 Tax=Aspergillus nanangensis TaxID=2582783 RepID=A0AAD4CIA2_ASPNN|nr:hypothetical protein FE257_010568 [Aspergillus nanangensis]